MYCTNIKVFNTATVDRDLWVRDNQYLNTGTLFGSEIDIDYAKITTSLTVPRLTTNVATVNNTLSAPVINCGNTAISNTGGNLNVDVQSADTFMYFKINGCTVASLTGRNTIVHYDIILTD